MMLESVLLLAGVLAHPTLPDAPTAKPDVFGVHRFYDRTGKIELAAAIAADAFDNAQTCHTDGDPHRREIGIAAQGCAGQTLALTAQLAGQELAAYLLHRTHHHKLERMVRFVTIQANIRGIVYSQRHGGF